VDDAGIQETVRRSHLTSGETRGLAEAGAVSNEQLISEDAAGHISDRLSEEAEGMSRVTQIEVPDPRLAFSGLISASMLKTEEMYRIPIMTKEKKRRAPVQLLAGVNFSTGQFDPGFTESGPSYFRSSDLMAVEDAAVRKMAFSIADKNNTISSEAYQPAVSYSYGIDLGARISRRWIIQSGFTYINANSWAKTSAYFVDTRTNQKTAVLSTVGAENDGLVQVVQTDEIQMKNTYNFASIPVRAGYLVLDRKLSIALLAGMTSDFLLSNNISHNSDFINSYTDNGGEDSPYNPVYFNGTISTSLGYLIGDHYYLNMEPSYRMALTDFTKEAFTLNSRPSSFFVTFGISYRFK
jgi:hypothetical protein